MRAMYLLMLAATVMSAGVGAARAQNATVFAATYLEVAPSSVDQALGLLQTLAAATRKADGNLGFNVVQERERPNRFVTLEAWKDQVSFELDRKGLAHGIFKEKFMPIRTAPPDERVNNGLAPSPGGLPAASRGSVWVVTHVDVPPPSKDACIAELKTLAEASRKDAGNLAFGVTQQANRPNHFTVVEVWQDQKAFDGHAVADHTKNFRAALGPMLGAPYEDRVYGAVE